MLVQLDVGRLEEHIGLFGMLEGGVGRGAVVLVLGTRLVGHNHWHAVRQRVVRHLRLLKFKKIRSPG